MAQSGSVERDSRSETCDNGSAPEGAGNTASGADPASLDNTEEHRLMPTLEPPTEGVKTPPATRVDDDELEPECPGFCGEHHWLDRPESDTRECLICGLEVTG